MKQLWYDPTTKKYCIDYECPCDFCKKQLRTFFFVYTYWAKRTHGTFFICKDCMVEAKKKQTPNIYVSMKLAVYTHNMDKSAHPIIERPPTLTPVRDISVFEAASDKIKADKVVDHTCLAGRPESTLDGVSIGYFQDDNKDAWLTAGEAEQVLTSIRNSKPLLTQNKSTSLLLKQQ